MKEKKQRGISVLVLVLVLVLNYWVKGESVRIEFECINRWYFKGVKAAMEFGDNYESSPWLPLNGVWTRTVERETGTYVGKGSDYVGYYQFALLTGLWIMTRISVTVEKFEWFYEHADISTFDLLLNYRNNLQYDMQTHNLGSDWGIRNGYLLIWVSFYLALNQ